MHKKKLPTFSSFPVSIFLNHICPVKVTNRQNMETHCCFCVIFQPVCVTEIYVQQMSTKENSRHCVTVTWAKDEALT